MNSLAHSCNGHLIKRVITQSPQALLDSIEVAGANVIEGLVDAKSSVVSSCTNILNDCWMACPDEMDLTFKRYGLMNTQEKIQIQCLDILTARVMSIPNLSFKTFTPSVVKLLNSSSPPCARKASDLLILFFSNAKDGAKDDLSKELAMQSVKDHFSSSILKSIGYKIASRPASTSISTSSQATSLLNIDFLINDQQYSLDSVTPENLFSADEFKREVTDMMPVFEGKETEFNWQQREKHISKLRSYLRGNGPTHFLEALMWSFKYASGGILKAANSLRTTLSSSACQLIKEMAIILGSNLDPIADTFLSNIIKMTALSKKISHANANLASSAIIANTSYSIRVLNHIQLLMSEKNIQPRLYSGKWFRIILYRHRAAKSSIESSGGREIIESCIYKGLSDASPGVREEMRQAFWAFNEVWPHSGQSTLARLDSSTRKALERSNPQPSKPKPPTSAKATRAGPSSLKDFIAQSRERTVGHSVAPRKPFEREKAEKTEQPKDLSVKAARLGISQKAQRRIPPSSSVVPQRPSSSVNALSQLKETSAAQKSASRELTRTVKSSDSRGNSTNHSDQSLYRDHGLTQKLPASQIDGPSDSRKTYNIPLTVAEQIKSDDFSTVLQGVRSIAEFWKAPSTTTVQIPSPNALSRFFKQMFAIGPTGLPKERWELIRALTHPVVISNLIQYVSATEIVLALILTQPQEVGVRALQELLTKVPLPQEKSSLCVYAVSSCLRLNEDVISRDSVIEYCFQVLQDIQFASVTSPSILEDIELLNSALNLTTPSPLISKYRDLLTEVVNARAKSQIAKVICDGNSDLEKISNAAVFETVLDHSIRISKDEVNKKGEVNNYEDAKESEALSSDKGNPCNDSTEKVSLSTSPIEPEERLPSAKQLRNEAQKVTKSESGVQPTALYFNEDNQKRTSLDIEIFDDNKEGQEKDNQPPSSPKLCSTRPARNNDINWLMAETESMYVILTCQLLTPFSKYVLI